MNNQNPETPEIGDENTAGENTAGTMQEPMEGGELPAGSVQETTEQPNPAIGADLGTQDQSSTVQEVKPEVKVEVAEEKMPEATAVVVPTEVKEEAANGFPVDEERAYIETVRQTGTDIQKRILAAVETFYNQMAPRAPIKPEVGTTYQHEFLLHLLWLLEKPFTDFKPAWNLLLVYFSVFHRDDNSSANYSPLSEYSTTRFMHAWSKGEEKAGAYTNLITLLRATRKRETRKHDIKMVNLPKVAPSVISAEALRNLQQFYGV